MELFYIFLIAMQSIALWGEIIMSNIKDVAKLAGVSPSTVSRVIADSSRISTPTKIKVQKAMDDLAYVPNASARSLARSVTKTIGFSISRPADLAFANPFFSEVIRGISSAAHQRDYTILLSMSTTPEEELENCLKLFKGRRVDGLILSTSRIKDELIATLTEEQFPFVVLGRSSNRSAFSVNNDNVYGAYIATSHLIENGFSNIAFLSGPCDLVVSQDRHNGYRQALMDHNIPYVTERVIETDFTDASGYQAMGMLTSRGQRCDAVVASDDMIALGVLRFAREKGLHVPNDLALIGFNDDPVVSFTNPAISSVKISTYELGLEATWLLLDILKEPNRTNGKKEIVLPCELIIRESSHNKK
jgi:DNA-binding LacI/PurR family transcriptional regulator